MTVPASEGSTGVVRYKAAEGQTVFPYGFKIFDSSHLKVYEGDTEITSGFSVSGVGNTGGGNVTYTTTPRATGAAAVTVTLKRNLPFSQPDDLPTQGALNTDTLESMIDKSRMVDQQLNEVDARSIKVPVSSGLSGLEVTPAASKLIGFDSAGTGLATYAASSIAATIVPTSYMETLLDDADAATARTTLGISDTESAVAGILESNTTFVDAVIFGPALDPVDWSGRTGATVASLMLATVEDTGADTDVTIWDLTASTLTSLTPIATVTLTGDATVTSISAAMGYIIIGSEDGISIVDPHDGSWAERTAGWPRNLTTSTTPALNDNSVRAVVAGFSDKPVFDPRTQGPMPTFALLYGSGSDIYAVMFDDGSFETGGGTAIAIDGIEIAGGRLFYCDNLTRILVSAPLSRYTLLTGSNTVLMDDDTTGVPDGFIPDNALAVASTGYGASASDDGLSLFGAILQDGTISATSVITRAYNSGFLVGDWRGCWLASTNDDSNDEGEKDRSVHANNMTATATPPTEAEVASGAELDGYSGFAAGVNFTAASNAEWDVITTGAVHLSGWFKSTGNGGIEDLFGFGNTGDTLEFYVFLAANGTVTGRDDGATAEVNTSSTQAYDDSAWHKIDFVRRSSTDRELYIDGVSVASNTTDAGSLTGTGALPFGIGVNHDGSSNPALTTTLALIRMSADAPTAAQVAMMYAAELGMFATNAKCTLQSSTTNTVLDVDVDPITGRIIATQSNSRSTWEGMVVVDDTATPVSGGTTFEHNKLFGGDRVEINDANLYATLAAKDLREELESLRGLKAVHAPKLDLSNAKAWFYGHPDGTILASHNIKSNTTGATGICTIAFGVPFKTVNYVALTSSFDASSAEQHTVHVTSQTAKQVIIARMQDAAEDEGNFYMLFFGELENE